MRQAGTLPSEVEAQRFADYLTTLGIQTRVEPQPPDWGVWILDEDRLPQAQQELVVFRQNPSEPRFQNVERAVRQLRQQADSRTAQLQKATSAGRRKTSGLLGGRPLTLLMIAISIGVALWSALPGQDALVRQWLSIAPFEIRGFEIRWPGLSNIARGEIWRLVTPIFVHASVVQGFGILHVLMNMMWLNDLGSQIEWRRGTWRLAAMVLLLAVTSNLGQYWTSHSPNFCGMSGVVFGLLGYVWVKARYQPALGLELGPGTMPAMMIFFALCWTGWLGPIANVAHATGLVVGVLMGYVPVVVGGLRRGK